MSSGAPLPPLNTPMLNPDGTVNMQWYQSFLTIYNRTGGSQGVSSTAVQYTACSAASTAITATTTAQSATVTANNGLALATTANSTAASALTLAEQLSVTALIKADVTIPVSLGFTGGASTLVQIYQPIVQSLTMPQNLANMAFYCGSRASTPVKFSVSYIRGGFSYTIGGWTLPIGTNYGILITSGNSPVNLQQGDTLIVNTLNTDPTLSNWAVTFAMGIT